MKPFVFVPHAEGTDHEIAILKERIRLVEQFNALEAQFAEAGAALTYAFSCLQAVASSMDAVRQQTEVIGAMLELPEELH